MSNSNYDSIQFMKWKHLYCVLAAAKEWCGKLIYQSKCFIEIN